MKGDFFLPDFGDDETPEENERFYKDHFVNSNRPRAKYSALPALAVLAVMALILWAVYALVN